jgi:uncharacterized protein
MSAALPETVDAWRMVAARRQFQGSLPLEDLLRLRESLANADGVVRFELEFGRDEVGVAYLSVDVQAELPLTCQRTLEVFEFPVRVRSRLGLTAREEDEAALPPGYEALLIPSGEVKPAEVIEDELILALPVVPLKPGTETPGGVVYEAGPTREESSPFAALASLKKKS